MQVTLIPKVLVPDEVHGRNDPRLMAAIKAWARNNIQSEVERGLDELNETMLFRVGDGIRLTYTIDIGEGILDTLAHACGIKLPED